MTRTLQAFLASALSLILGGGLASASGTFSVVNKGLLPGDAQLGIASNTQQEHSIAIGAGSILVAWTDYRAQSVGDGTNQSGGEIFGARLDLDGNMIDPAPFLIAGGQGLQQRPLVAWNGQNWLVLYTSQDPVGGYYEDRMRAVRVSPLGQVLDATPILFPATEFSPSTVGMQIAGLQGQWLITRCVYHADGYGTYLAGQRISAAGQLLDPQPIMLMDWIYGPTKTIASNNEYLVVGPDWNNSTTIKARRINTNAQPIGSSFTLPSMNIAGNGTDYYVTWISNYVNLVGSRVSSTGTLLTPAGTLIKADYSQYSLSTLGHDGTNWWLVWGAADILHTVRINAAGAVIDGDGGPTLPITIGGTVNTAYSPIIMPRTGGGIQLFWYDLRQALGNDANVFMLPVSAANVAETERCVSLSTPLQRTPDFCPGPAGQTALVFVSELANDDRVLLHLLGPTGDALAPEPIEVWRAASIGRASIAWNGSIYLVTWDEATGIKSMRLNPDGTTLDPAPVALMPGFSPDVEALGGDFLIASARVHTYPQTIFAQGIRISGATGQPLDAGPFILMSGYVSTGPRVHTDGTRWIVTYHSNWSHDNPQSDVVYNFVNTDGTFTPARNPATTSGTGGTPDVAWSGNKFLFVWRGNSLSNANNYIGGRIMNADGTFATGNFVIAEAAGRQLRPVVSWDGANFVVVWDDQRNQESFFDERTDIYGARVSESGAVLDPAGFQIYRGPSGDATAAVISRFPESNFVAYARFVTDAPFDSYRIGLSIVGVPTLAGDLNCDGFVNNFDIDPFVLALVDPAAYATTFPGCSPARGDINHDGAFNNFDIDPFVMCIISGCP